jgi:hypothetical protein
LKPTFTLEKPHVSLSLRGDVRGAAMFASRAGVVVWLLHFCPAGQSRPIIFIC